jgi:hypothetical protein
MQAVRVSNRDDLQNLLARCLNLTKEQVLERLNDTYVSLAEETILRSMIRDLELGDTKTLDKILDRLFGKAVQVVAAQVNAKTLEDLVVGSAKDISPTPDENSSPQGDYEV